MPRNLNIENLQASEEQVVRPVMFVELGYDSGTSRIHNSIVTITWGGNEWLGVGTLGAIDTIEESTELKVSGLGMALSGLSNDVVGKVLDENYQGRPAKVYIGWLDENMQLLANPEQVFYGFIDTQSISVGQTAQVSITVENRLVDWDRPRVLRFNNETQQARFFGDRGLEFVEQAAEKQIVWGQKAPS